MSLKDVSYLRIVKSQDEESARKENTIHDARPIIGRAKWVLLIVMVIYGFYLLLATHCYTNAFRLVSYDHADHTDHYATAGDKIIRYNKNGVSYLDEKNNVIWSVPARFRNPVVDQCGESWVVADLGGTKVSVFTKEGLKGEFEAPAAISDVAVSGQGIVAVTLTGRKSSMILLYDAMGNLLVENKISKDKRGEPEHIAISPDGTVLAVAMMKEKNNVLSSEIVCYNFAEAGQEADQFIVTEESCGTADVTDLFFMDQYTLVSVIDEGFSVFTGGEIPQKLTDVELGKKVYKVFHSDKYLGFLTVDQDSSGYEVGLYNKNGMMLLNRSVTEDYDHIELVGEEILLSKGKQAMILTTTGLPRFNGSFNTAVRLFKPLNGWNQYLLIDQDQFGVVVLK